MGIDEEVVFLFPCTPFRFLCSFDAFSNQSSSLVDYNCSGFAAVSDQKREKGERGTKRTYKRSTPNWEPPAEQ